MMMKRYEGLTVIGIHGEIVRLVGAVPEMHPDWRAHRHFEMLDFLEGSSLVRPMGENRYHTPYLRGHQRF